MDVNIRRQAHSVKEMQSSLGVTSGGQAMMAVKMIWDRSTFRLWTVIGDLAASYFDLSGTLCGQKWYSCVQIVIMIGAWH